MQDKPAVIYIKRPEEKYWYASDTFPHYSHCHADGIIAIGGDYHPTRLLEAYRRGIFPWPYSANDPILWHFPHTRFVLYTADLHISKSLKRTLKKTPYKVRVNTAFKAVIEGCSHVDRGEDTGTWIYDALIDGYYELHKKGYAHSVETWDGDNLVGGFYGVSIGRMFFGESMFATVKDASKIAFAHFVPWLRAQGYPLIDCQAYTQHLERFGATHINQTLFLNTLIPQVEEKGLSLPWELPSDPRIPLTSA